MSEPYLSVIIPVFNEEKRIHFTIQETLEYLTAQSFSWEVLVVDDGSSDSTAAVVEGASSSTDRLRLVRLPHRGKGWAVQQGMLLASGAYRFFADADLSMSMEQLSRFIPPAQTDFSIAIASRQVEGANRFNEPRLRYLMGRIFNRITQLLALRNISDTQCGFKCFRGDVADELFSLQRTRGFSFDIEILFLAQKKGFRIEQIPIDWYYHGESKVQRLRDAVLMVKDILLIQLNHLLGKYNRPGLARVKEADTLRDRRREKLAMREIQDILRQSKTIASVGISPDGQQVANRVSRILKHWGYKVIPVNPDYDQVIGERCYANLSAIPYPVDIALLFRRSENVPPHVEEAIAIGASAVWMPLSVINADAAAKATSAGLDTVMDRCIECACVELGLFPPHKLED